MTDWRKIAKALALADGRISEREVNILRKEFLVEGKAISKPELDFLHELKKEAKSVVHPFDVFIAEAEKKKA